MGCCSKNDKESLFKTTNLEINHENLKSIKFLQKNINNIYETSKKAIVRIKKKENIIDNDFIGGNINENPNNLITLPIQELKLTNDWTGLLISPDGYILTFLKNYNGTDLLKVQTFSLKEYDTELILFDTETYLAILKICESKSLPYLKLNFSYNLQIGDIVILIDSERTLNNPISFSVINFQDIDFINNVFPFQKIYNLENVKFHNACPVLNLYGEVVAISLSYEDYFKKHYIKNFISTIKIIPIKAIKNYVSLLIKSEKAIKTENSSNDNFNNSVKQNQKTFSFSGLKFEEHNGEVIIIDINNTKLIEKYNISKGYKIIRIDNILVKSLKDIILYIDDLKNEGFTEVQIKCIKENNEIILNLEVY